MNIAFFLIAKKDTVHLPFHSTMRQALEKMEFHHYTAIPLVDEDGKYAGTLTEGDLLWKMKNTPSLTFADTGHIWLNDIPRRMVNTPIHINEEMENLLSLAIMQNFIPVIADNDVFCGIIRRREIIEYFARQPKASL